MSTVLSGVELSKIFRQQILEEVADFRLKNISILLTFVLVGNNESVNNYTLSISKMCNKVGVGVDFVSLPQMATTQQVVEKILQLNEDKKVSGIIVQLPLPKHIDKDSVIDSIAPIKDVDGLTNTNAGLLYLDRPCLTPNTPMGALLLLKSTQVDLVGKSAVVIGRSSIVGKPMAMLLLKEGATITICHSHTLNLKEITLKADIIVSAVGKAKIVTADMVKPGAIVIDVGTNYVDGKLCGDVDFESVSKVASYITPVPGGCGPMTTTCLILNTIIAAKMQEEYNQ